MTLHLFRPTAPGGLHRQVCGLCALQMGHAVDNLGSTTVGSTPMQCRLAAAVHQQRLSREPCRRLLCSSRGGPVPAGGRRQQQQQRSVPAGQKPGGPAGSPGGELSSWLGPRCAAFCDRQSVSSVSSTYKAAAAAEQQHGAVPAGRGGLHRQADASPLVQPVPELGRRSAGGPACLPACALPQALVSHLSTASHLP